jgi:hypothetical protein
MYNMQYFLYGHRCIDWCLLECVLVVGSCHQSRGAIAMHATAPFVWQGD